MSKNNITNYRINPTYNLEKQNEVTVSIAGKMIDENYTKLLMRRPDLDMKTAILLDKVQKSRLITKQEVEESPEPVFVRWKDQRKTFCVREGPKTNDLDSESTWRYIKNRWG